MKSTSVCLQNKYLNKRLKFKNGSKRNNGQKIKDRLKLAFQELSNSAEKCCLSPSSLCKRSHETTKLKSNYLYYINEKPARAEMTELKNRFSSDHKCSLKSVGVLQKALPLIPMHLISIANFAQRMQNKMIMMEVLEGYL